MGRRRRHIARRYTVHAARSTQHAARGTSVPVRQPEVPARVPVVGAILGTLLAVIAGSVPSLAQSGPVLVIDMKGAVGVASKRQLSQALERASGEKAEVLVIRLDTPGGLVSATRDMIQSIVAAPVPIVVHVAPSGARAASRISHC